MKPLLGETMLGETINNTCVTRFRLIFLHETTAVSCFLSLLHASASYNLTLSDKFSTSPTVTRHTKLKPWLHKQFFACDGDAIFLKTVASPARGGGYTWQQISTKSVILLQKIQLVEFLRICFCEFFSCCITCARVATHYDFRYALATRQFSKKSHHHRKQKIAHVGAA